MLGKPETCAHDYNNIREVLGRFLQKNIIVTNFYILKRLKLAVKPGKGSSN